MKSKTYYRIKPEARRGYARFGPGTVFVGKEIQRNEPCPCGSGKKFKKCCLNVDTSTQGRPE